MNPKIIILQVVVLLFIHAPAFSQVTFVKNSIYINLASKPTLQFSSVTANLGKTYRSKDYIKNHPLYINSKLEKRVFDKEGISVAIDSLGKIKLIEFYFSAHSMEEAAMTLPSDFVRRPVYLSGKKIGFETSQKEIESILHVKPRHSFLDYEYYYTDQYCIRVIYKNNGDFISEVTILFNEEQRNSLGWGKAEKELEKTNFLLSYGKTNFTKFCEDNHVDPTSFLECAVEETSKIVPYENYFFDEVDDSTMVDIIDKCVEKTNLYRLKKS